jgi:hypothetical protein
MMLRSLVDEVVRRRLWPIPLLALLVAIAAPLLFMKSAPPDAPASTEAPPAAAPGELPASAEKLVTTSDKAVAPRQTTKRKAQDPFAPPAGAEKKATGSTAQAASQPAAKQTASSSKPIPIVITDANGNKLTVSSPKKKTSSTKKPATKATTPPPPPAAAKKGVVYVDVRFAEKGGSKVSRRVPRMQTFRAAGKVAAIFVKYSPSRRKAVFAVAPSTRVTGDVKCRRKEGVCRYVDIPEGKHVRLVMRAADGSVVSRRLDVVKIHGEPAPTTAAAVATAPLSTPLDQATCLLKRLLSLSPILPSISVDACD